jgi:hypothetical protein
MISDLVDGAGELGEVNPKGRVGDALGQQRQHHQSGYDKYSVRYSLDLLDARSDGRTKHHEIQ